MARMVENRFSTILTSLTSYSTYKYVLQANKSYGIIQHSWLQIVTLWATISTYLWAKMAKNGWKQVFHNTYFHDLLFHTQVSFMGQTSWVKLSYGITKGAYYTDDPYSYPMDHYIYSFVTKNVLTLLKNMFAMITSITSYSAHKTVLRANEWCQIMLWYHPTCP
jgi:hypothetical protein